VSSQDRTNGPAAPAAADQERQADLSRRTVLRGAAGAGVAGLAVGALASAAVAPAWAATAGRRPDAKHATGADGADRSVAARDVVVHLRDARSGEMDIFSGTSQTRLRDPELAARLVRAAS
jgi:hypothetical protein